ncbi:MAG: hypothetical protein JO078_11510 [Candidatus Eremiobacteraeota bacterium]|nr:hypothetical protein [Candidatus Eremiobacteraeota bacterium]MBV9057478.1 hypothetical protein [Candidatus Eremiobacteraeota bacterium]MBV9700736.1 hypothetical protein [Candidatus Eremiobacteraeota bacterium]
MRKNVVIACLVAPLLAACSNGIPSGAAGVDPSKFGAAPGSRRLPIIAAPAQSLQNPSMPAAKGIPRDLYVADLGAKFGTGGIFILKNRSYKEVGAITNGISQADGIWVDQHGNVYAANASGGNATEYAPHGSSPICTYSGATDPINVSTDAKDHVYVADWNNGSNGAILEYKQCKNKIINHYSFNSYTAPEAAVADASGNLFVAYYNSQGPPSAQGAFEEFAAGSMTPKQLKATVMFPGGMVVDKHGDLIVADQGTQGQTNGAVDVIAPPYKTPKAIASNLTQPFHLTLNHREKLLFVNSLSLFSAHPTVWVMSYPSGTILTTLNSSNGLQYPTGVAESPPATL